jgi:hypothetical protein
VNEQIWLRAAGPREPFPDASGLVAHPLELAACPPNRTPRQLTRAASGMTATGKMARDDDLDAYTWRPSRRNFEPCQLRLDPALTPKQPPTANSEAFTSLPGCWTNRRLLLFDVINEMLPDTNFAPFTALEVQPSLRSRATGKSART